MKKLNVNQQRLVTENIEFARDLALGYKNRGVDVEDLQSASIEGLCEAALNFKEDSKASFKTYAYNICKRFIINAIGNCTLPMTVPESCHAKIEMLHLDLTFDELGGADNDEGTDADRLLAHVAEHTIEQVMVNEDEVAELYKAINTRLSKKEREVIVRRYGLCGEDELSRAGTAQVMGISAERVRQIENKALGKLEQAII